MAAHTQDILSPFSSVTRVLRANLAQETDTRSCSLHFLKTKLQLSNLYNVVPLEGIMFQGIRALSANGPVRGAGEGLLPGRDWPSCGGAYTASVSVLICGHQRRILGSRSES
jgi:hypothetical protein